MWNDGNHSWRNHKSVLYQACFKGNMAMTWFPFLTCCGKVSKGVKSQQVRPCTELSVIGKEWIATIYGLNSPSLFYLCLFLHFPNFFLVPNPMFYAQIHLLVVWVGSRLESLSYKNLLWNVDEMTEWEISFRNWSRSIQWMDTLTLCRTCWYVDLLVAQHESQESPKS